MKALFVAAASVVGIALCACSTSTEPDTVVSPNEPGSSLTLRWSVDSSVDPNACTQEGADTIDISITDPNTGGEISAFQQTCGAFSTSIVLAPGSYGGRARLLDGSGRAITTDVSIPPFTLFGNDELVQTVDFPSDSFTF